MHDAPQTSYVSPQLHHHLVPQTPLEVLQDLTVYSGALLSHLYSLEHQRLERLAHRRVADLHGNVRETAQSHFDANHHREEERPGEEPKEENEAGAAPAPLNVAERHRVGVVARLRPFIILGFHNGPPPPPLNGSTTFSAGQHPSDVLIEVFNRYFFPAELFDGDGEDHVQASVSAAGGVSEPLPCAEERGHPVAAEASTLTPDILRETFHQMIVLCQRCSQFALLYRNIAGPSAAASSPQQSNVAGGGAPQLPSKASMMVGEEGEEDDTAPLFTASSLHDAGADFDDTLRGSGGTPVGQGAAAPTNSSTSAEDAHDEQHVAAFSLQFLLQLADSSPCPSLSYVVQLCLAHALATGVPPSTADGVAARQQLLSCLPVLAQRPKTCLNSDIKASEAPVAGGTAVLPHGVQQQQQQLVGSSAGYHTSHSRVPATMYIHAEDQVLWFDSCGNAAVCEVHQWTSSTEAGTDGRTSTGPVALEGEAEAGLVPSLPCVASLPATTALPTVQRLLMEEDVGGPWSAASQLQQILDTVVEEAAVSTRLPDTSAMLVQATSRRRRSGASRMKATEEHEVGGVSALVPPSAGLLPLIDRHRLLAHTAPPMSKSTKRRRALLLALSQCRILPTRRQLSDAKAMLYNVFTNSGECPTYYRLLSLYPEVLRAHHVSMQYVLYGDGPLPIDVRLMIAVMAASRHKCEYLVSMFAALLMRYAESTLKSNEDQQGEWGSPHMRSPDRHPPPAAETADGGIDSSGGGSGTRGGVRAPWIIHGPPPRLQAVQHFIAIAAHTPWMLKEDHVRAVLRAGWTVPELFQLVALVAHIIPLCGFVMGLFIPAEPWTVAVLPVNVVSRMGHRAVGEDATVTRSSGHRGGGSSTGAESPPTSTGSMARRRVATASHRLSDVSNACLGPATPSFTTLRGASSGGARTGEPVTPTGLSAGLQASVEPVDVYRLYAGVDNIVSEQRIKGSSGVYNPHTLWRSQFTWAEVGSTLMDQYYPGAAPLLNDEIDSFLDVVRQLTEADCVGLKSPEYNPTYAFRSLQLYVLNLLGFMVEDYPYNDINKVLRRPAKWFAQVLTMRPETLTRTDVVRWYGPATPPIAKAADGASTADSSLETHQLKSIIELLAVVDHSQGGHRGGIESASAHPEVVDGPAPTIQDAEREAREAAALQVGLTLQDERVLLLIALATMEARKEGLLHILLRPVCCVLSNM